MYSAVAIDEDGNAVAPVPIFQRRKPLGAALGAFLFVMIGVVGSSMMTLRDGGRKPSLTLAEDTTEETLKVSNAYERLYGRSIGDGVSKPPSPLFFPRPLHLCSFILPMHHCQHHSLFL